MAKRTGRPKWAPDPLQVAKAKEYAKTGVNQDMIARALGIAPSTLYKYLVEHPGSEFSEALKTGKAVAVTVVAGKLLELALKGNIAAVIFYLKSQAGFRDRVELSGDPDRPLDAARTARTVKLPRAMEDAVQKILTDAAGGAGKARKA